MTWNHRVIKHVTEHETYYGIHEVFYGKEGLSWTTKPVKVIGYSIGGLQKQLNWMLAATGQPVMVIKDGELVEEK